MKSKEMPAVNLCAFGNSLTAGFGLSAQDSLPGQLLPRLRDDGYRVEIQSHGLSGDTTSGGLNRIQAALRHQPDLVILELGINDFLTGVPAHEIKRNLERLIQACLQVRALVLLAGFKAPPGFTGFQAGAFNALYPDLAQAYTLTLFPDFLHQVVDNPELTLPDGLHPNAQGIAFIVNRLAPVVEKLLEAMCRGENT